jgi:cell division protein FtsW (lipid II flippase)
MLIAGKPLTDRHGGGPLYVLGSPARVEAYVIVLGVILLVVGYFLPIAYITPLGIILIVIGVILLLMSTVAGHSVGGRTNWY